VGAILVKEKRILSTGYNGAPSGVDHCLDVGCLREQKNIPSGERHELCRGSHAEQNAIVQAAAALLSKMPFFSVPTFPAVFASR
jgi:dCMP deaminase